MPLLIASSPICWILDNYHSPLTYLDLIESIILEISFSLFLIMYCSNFLLKTLFIDKAIDNITMIIKDTKDRINFLLSFSFFNL